MKNILTLFPIFLLLCGCSITLSMPYQTATTAELKGNIEVENFKFHPKSGFSQDQIRNTAIGSVYLTENVDTFFTNALKREMRQSALSIKSGAGCKLSGTVNDFAIDDLGYSVTYISNVHYVLSGNSGKTIFGKTYDVKFDTSKHIFMEAMFANVNKAISDNINKLLTDPVFQEVIKSSCQ